MKTSTPILFLLLSFFLLSPSIMADDVAPVPSVEYVVVNATIAPVRENPSEAAEQATQLLFGEVCEVIERRSSWTKIRNTTDGQVGWVSRSMLTPTNTQHPTSAVIYTPFAIATPANGGAPLLLTLGTRLPYYANGTFQVLDQLYHIDSTCVYQPISNTPSEHPLGETPSNRHRIVAIAKSLLNTPYLWGGKNAMGLDCSGFTQVVYAAIGVNILRNAREQVTQGELVTSLEEAMPGDLAFFDHADRDPSDTRITHVGILLSPTEIIHCAGGRVHIDRIDSNGIYTAKGTKTHHLAQIKRYL